MSANFFDLQRYAATGITSPNMTDFDKMRARALFPQSYPSITVTGIPPLSFKANGQPLSAWSIVGNSRQDVTPTPDAPIYPDFVGTLSAGSWTIPISCGGQTVHVYLGQVQTVRRIKKRVFDGTENWGSNIASQGALRFYLQLENTQPSDLTIGRKSMCTHFPLTSSGNTYNVNNSYTITSDQKLFFRKKPDTTLNGWKQWLADQYSAGTPVTVWYVLAEPETGNVNEPLAKIGDYADTVSSTNIGAPSIPTVKGTNTLSVVTTVQPSEVSITT